MVDKGLKSKSFPITTQWIGVPHSNVIWIASKVLLNSLGVLPEPCKGIYQYVPTNCIYRKFSGGRGWQRDFCLFIDSLSNAPG